TPASMRIASVFRSGFAVIVYPFLVNLMGIFYLDINLGIRQTSVNPVLSRNWATNNHNILASESSSKR
ncbi:hypothetical protein, partial [Nitratifractor sp.]